MTNPHAKAVEAAVNEAACAFEDADRGVAYALRNIHTEEPMRIAITAYLAAMRAEGWVMVRDCGEATAPLGDTTKPTDVRLALEDAYEDGWNACRAAMLKGAGDGQG